MLSDRIGALVRGAREQLGLSQAGLARRSGVSKRLVGEIERGQRPNVSLETTLRLLDTLGVSLRLALPDGRAVDLRGPSAPALGREARAARRRATWSGLHVPLEEAGTAPSGGGTMSDRLAAVAEVSRHAYAIARAPQSHPPRRTTTTTRHASPKPHPTSSKGRP